MAQDNLAPTALPKTGQVIAGQAQIGAPTPDAMVIDQQTDRAVLTWDQFDIGRDASVTFNQPDTGSVALNRVTGAAPSQIFGRLEANGQVFVTNRNGLYFSPTARVDVGGLVATTHDLSNDAFMENNLVLERQGATGAVVTEGSLTARDGGYIALLAPEVRNQGVITARLGTAALAAGESYELAIDDGGDLVSIHVAPAEIATLVENGHMIVTPGGQTILSAGAAQDLRAGVVRNTGTIEARGITQQGGRVFLGGGRVETTATSRIVATAAPEVSVRPERRPGTSEVHIDASAAHLAGEISAGGAQGGTIAVEADRITLAGEARFDASGMFGGGAVLIGGDWQGGGSDRRVFAFPDAMRQASHVDMQPGAQIDASGDGGTIVLWSNLQDGQTLAFGSLLATGGQIETSGAQLDITGVTVDAGVGGDWLIDPFDYTINASAANTIVGALNGGTNVEVTTAVDNAAQGSTGSGDGNLSVTSAITSSGTGDLTLTADNTASVIAAIDIGGALTVTGNSVDINAGVTADGDISITATGTDVMLEAALSNTATGPTTLDISAVRNVRLGIGSDISSAAAMDTTLRADTDSDGDGIIFVESSSIATNGGNLNFGQSGQTAVIGGETVLVGGDTFFQSGAAQTLSTGGGALNIYGEVLVSNTSGLTITTGGGDATLHGLVNSGNAYTFVDRTANVGSGSWTEARTDAINGTGGGANVGDSYLVNITSRLENSISGLVANYVGAWIGAHRADPAGSYNWTFPDGPEAGVHFFTQSGSSASGGGSAETGYYSNFGSNEPNGALSASGEDVGQFFGTAGQWNDLGAGTTYSDNTNTSQYAVKGFVRETNIAGSPLTINAGTGSVTLDGGVGTRRSLASIDVTAADTTVDGEGISTTGTQDYSGDLTITGGPDAAELTGGTITVGGTLTGAVAGTLEQNATLATSTDVALSGTTIWDLRTSQTLASLDMAAGTAITNSTGGAGLSVSGASTLAGSVTTENAQTYSGAVTLAGDTVLRTAASNISFGGTVDSDTPGTARSLTAWIDPETTYYWADWVTATATSVTGTITVGSDVINVVYSNPNGFFGTELSGGTNYWTGPVGGAFVGTSPYISQNIDNGPTSDIIQLQNQGSQTLTFSQPVENLAFSIVSMNGNGYGFDQDFTIESYTGFDAGLGTASAGYYGTGAFETAFVGGVYQLNDAQTNAPSEPHGTIRFTGSFSDLTWDSLSNETWNGFTVGVSGTTSTAGEVIFNSSTGATAALGDVTINANMATAADISGAATITINGVADLGGDISTTGDQDYNEQVTLATDVVLATTGGGNVTFARSVDGAQTLSVTTIGAGDVAFDGEVGAATALSELTVSAAEISAGDITLAANATLDISNTAGGTLTGVISGSGVSLEKAGSGALTLSGANTFDGGTTVADGILVQGVAASGTPGNLTDGAFGTGDVAVADGAALDANGITLAYGVDIAGTGVSNSGAIFNSTSTGTTLSGPITLGGDAAIRSAAGGALTFDGTVNGAAHLTVGTNALLTFNAIVGGSTALTGLTTDSGTSNTGFTAAANTTGDISVTATDLAIGGALSSSAGDIYLTASGAVTQTAALSATGLNLAGAGDFALTHTANAVTTLAGGSSGARIGALDFVNAGALNIGTVTDTGLTASDTVAVATLTGNLTLGAGIETSATAITLNAGKNATAGTATGGNIIVSGSPTVTVGSGGTIRLFTGSVSGSTGLTDLVGSGSGRFRYNSDDTNTNYTATLDQDVANAIYRESITVTGSLGSQSITYGDTIAALDTSGLTGPVNGDATAHIAIASPLYATSGNLQAGSYGITATDLGDLGYVLGTMTPATLSVAQKPVTLSGLTATDRVYDGTSTATLNGTATISSGGTISGDGATLTGDSVALSGTASGSFTNPNAAAGSAVTVTGLSLNGTDASNYALTDPGLSADIAPRVVTLSATRVYDGTTDLTGAVTLSTGIFGEELTYTGATAANAHVAGPDGDTGTADNAIASLTLADGTGLASNYVLPTLNAATAPLSITPRTVTVTITNSDVTKVYDATTDAPIGFLPSFALSGLASGDTGGTLSSSLPTYDSADVAAATELMVAGLSLDGVTGSLGSATSDYTLSGTTATVAATITPAPLAVTANNDAKFISQTDDSDFAGASFNGFVGGETTADLSGALSVTRTNAGTEAAGTYADVLIASGLGAQNYTITYLPGDFTITPADQLMIEFADLTHVYGSETTYRITRASYFDGVTEFRLDDGSVSGSSVSVAGDNTVTVNDGSGGSGVFRVGAGGSVASGAGLVAAGSYQIAMVGTMSGSSGNFSDTVTVVGAHSVSQQSLTATASGGLSRVYDGTTAMTDLTFALATPETGDTLSITGTGAFDDDAAGTGKGYTVSNLTLGGSDAANYTLTTGPSFSASDGVITPRRLLVTFDGVDRVYDGSTTATVTSRDDRVNGDNLTINRSARFDDKNTGTDKPVSVSGVSLSGGDAANYIVLPTGATTAAITRLASVTWVGGPNGDWFDPANWAGGAVPDLRNVASVIIPDGVRVTFGTDITPPAQAGPVRLDRLGNDGTLVQLGGTLNVGTGGVTLDGYAQSGGTLTSDGDIQLGRLTQSGGSLGTDGNLIVTDDFAQSGDGTITVGGDADLTDGAGGLMIGNLTVAGDLTATSTAGPITQPSGTTIAVGGNTALTASDGGTSADIVLDSPTNDFVGTVSATGKDVTLRDANGLTVDNVTAAGGLTTTAEGALRLVGRIASEWIELESLTGSVTQPSGVVITSGAGPNSVVSPVAVTLAQPGNVIDGGLTVTTPDSAVTGDAQTTIARDAGAAAARDRVAGPAPAADNAPLPVPLDLSLVASSDVVQGGNQAGLTITLVETASRDTAARVIVSVPAQMLDRESLSFELPEDAFNVLGTKETLVAAMPDGTALPAWLTFSSDTRVFTARAIPAGGLPVDVIVKSGTNQIDVSITLGG